MAVVFISPKQRQKMFFLFITAGFLVFLILISFGVFFTEIESDSVSLTFNKPKVSINMSVFDSEQFQKLQPFSEMQIQYVYKAVDKSKKQILGFISAISKEEAQKYLEEGGLEVIEIKETEIGRDNPFAPYYQQVIQQSKKTK